MVVQDWRAVRRRVWLFYRRTVRAVAAVLVGRAAQAVGVERRVQVRRRRRGVQPRQRFFPAVSSSSVTIGLSQCVAGRCCFVDAFISLLENPYCSKQAAKWRLISALKAGSSRTESESSVETTIATVTTADTNTLSAPVSTLPPTSTASTAAAARLAPFRLW